MTLGSGLSTSAGAAWQVLSVISRPLLDKVCWIFMYCLNMLSFSFNFFNHHFVVFICSQTNCVDCAFVATITWNSTWPSPTQCPTGRNWHSSWSMGTLGNNLRSSIWKKEHVVSPYVVPIHSVFLTPGPANHLTAQCVTRRILFALTSISMKPILSMQHKCKSKVILANVMLSHNRNDFVSKYVTLYQ